jgi:hypothetical protein
MSRETKEAAGLAVEVSDPATWGPKLERGGIPDAQKNGDPRWAVNPKTGRLVLRTGAVYRNLVKLGTVRDEEVAQQLLRPRSGAPPRAKPQIVLSRVVENGQTARGRAPPENVRRELADEAEEAIAAAQPRSRTARAANVAALEARFEKLFAEREPEEEDSGEEPPRRRTATAAPRVRALPVAAPQDYSESDPEPEAWDEPPARPPARQPVRVAPSVAPAPQPAPVVRKPPERWGGTRQRRTRRG